MKESTTMKRIAIAAAGAAAAVMLLPGTSQAATETTAQMTRPVTHCAGEFAFACHQTRSVRTYYGAVLLERRGVIRAFGHYTPFNAWHVVSSERIPTVRL